VCDIVARLQAWWRKPVRHRKTRKPATSTAAEMQALKDAIAAQQAALAAQQQEIQQLRDELASQGSSVDQAQAAASDAASKAAAAQAQASQQQEAVIGLKADVSDLRTNALSTTVTLQEVQKNVKAEIESPVALHYRESRLRRAASRRPNLCGGRGRWGPTSTRLSTR